VASALDFWCPAKISIATHHQQERRHREKATMSEVWNTKYGSRRVRFDPPTLKEAIFAARGLTGELQQQAEIVASLMELPVQQVRAELLKMAPTRSNAQIVTNGREGIAKTVIVERKRSRIRRR